MTRNDASAKLDAEVIRKAKLVATTRGITLAEYLTSIVGPIAARDLREAMATMMDPPAAKTGKKGGAK
jgi:hypothetical protein